MSYDHWKTTEPDFWTDYCRSREDEEDLEADRRQRDALPPGCVCADEILKTWIAGQAKNISHNAHITNFICK